MQQALFFIWLLVLIGCINRSSVRDAAFEDFSCFDISRVDEISANRKKVYGCKQAANYKKVCEENDSEACHWQLEKLFESKDFLRMPGKNLGTTINTQYKELAPILSRDGQTLFFVREGHPENAGSKKLRDDQDIWISHRTSNGWGTASRIDSLVNDTYYNFAVGISRNGRDLYLGNLYGDVETRKGGISLSRYEDGTWKFPNSHVIKNYHNKASYANYHVHFDGELMLVNIQGTDAVGRLDIYVSFFQEKRWSEPANCGPVLNSKSNEVTPHLSPDKRKVFFASDRPGGYGGFDIYVSERHGDSFTSWTPPRNAGRSVNTPLNDFNPVLLPGGRQAIISRGGRDQDLILVNLP